MRSHLSDYATAEPAPRESGYGFDAVMLLEQARIICGDKRFAGSAASALRQAGRERDADITRAVKLLKLVRPPERIVKEIAHVPSREQEAFRRRMCADFDSARDRLIEAAKPSDRRTTARRAARDAQNWSGEMARGAEARKEQLTADEVWERVFRQAMSEHDQSGRARGIGGEVFVHAPRPGRRA